MKDVYTDTMDAIKAPAALVDKTLNLMLEEQKNMKTKSDASTDLPKAQALAAQASSKKNRWISQVLLPAACLCLCLSVVAPRLFRHEVDAQITPPIELPYNQSLGSPPHETQEIEGTTESIETAKETISAEDVGIVGDIDHTAEEEITKTIIQALAADNLATRSGPATRYRETGTYPIKGKMVGVISLAYDPDGLCWVQCEIVYGNKLRRVYTGVQRLEAASFDVDSVPMEAPLDQQHKVIATSKAMYGPGDGYDSYDQLTVDKGQTVTLISVENGYAQVEWTTSVQSYRAWVPVHILEF